MKSEQQYRDEFDAAMNAGEPVELVTPPEGIKFIEFDEFDDLAKQIHPTNVEKGFWGPPEMMDKYVAKLCLIHSEVSEVMEALRKSQGADKVTEEFADILIRLFDLYGELVDAGEADPKLFKVMHDKMEANANRPPKHGNRWG